MDYTEYAYEEPLYQGGFIREYIDHGIAVTSPDGKPGFAYGGDFGDRPTDREFCVDGLVLPDRCALFQRGVGGDNSWGAKPHEEACLAVETGMTFSFSIQKRNR